MKRTLYDDPGQDTVLFIIMHVKPVYARELSSGRTLNIYFNNVKDDPCAN